MKNDPIRYFKRDETFFLQGKFHLYEANNNQIKEEKTIFIHSGTTKTKPEGTGLLTFIQIDYLCIFKSQISTLFITASEEEVQILYHAAHPLSEEILRDICSKILEIVEKVCNSKVHTEIISSYSLIEASCKEEKKKGGEGEEPLFFEEIITHAISRARQHLQNRPSFQIFIPVEEKGNEASKGRWHEWIPEECSYYPCHHIEDQVCDYCYCPCYPCCDENLGSCITSSKGEKIWSCQSCAILHHPEVATYLRRHPTVSLEELKSVHARRS